MVPDRQKSGHVRSGVGAAGPGSGVSFVDFTSRKMIISPKYIDDDDDDDQY